MAQTIYVTSKGYPGGNANPTGKILKPQVQQSSSKPAYVTDKRYVNAANAYNKQLQSQYAAQQQAMANQLATSKASTASNYDSTAAQAYVNYAKQKNALPEMLRSQGLTGGASESALVNMQNNYALNQSNNEASRAAAMAQLQNTYDTNIANLKSELDRTVADNNYKAKQQQIEFNYNMQQKALEQYKATIERYTSTKQIDKAIKKLNKKDPNYKAMKQLLQLRKAQLKEAEAQKSSGNKSGSRRSYRSSGGYSSSGNSNSGNSSGNATTAAYNKAAANTDPGYNMGFGGKAKKTSKSTRGGSEYTAKKNLMRAGIW